MPLIIKFIVESANSLVQKYHSTCVTTAAVMLVKPGGGVCSWRLVDMRLVRSYRTQNINFFLIYYKVIYINVISPPTTEFLFIFSNVSVLMQLI